MASQEWDQRYAGNDLVWTAEPNRFVVISRATKPTNGPSRTRINMNKSVALNTTIRQGTSGLINSSSNFDSSNYSLHLYSIEPDLTYTHKSNLRIGLGYRLSTKANSMEWGGQNYTSTGFNSDFKYNILQSTSIQGKFIFSEISYTSKEGTPSVTAPVSYIILEGLQPGRNYEWGLDFTKRLGSSLESQPSI